MGGIREEGVSIGEMTIVEVAGVTDAFENEDGMLTFSEEALGDRTAAGDRGLRMLSS